ncbi:pyridoxamine 5'-phosphate oxidase family protein [Microbacterium sp. CFH 31415]|uniref:pyridoxamine 5'-phosphate oxidase family protein n=1 Tax=Microbacterium sp. CFH 31415 TaxID=2921732 RepID=UPI001F143445|nr:pyridoxamine 5'-phosphate oxidase family protein [Microbacterium sp. CFH 31415]MCH6231455.1 pyridoxamine 5'-phosphate oxidase family protein [Microbacterium sp. CFH 31415]
MADTPDPVAALSDEQCWERLRTQELGRLVTHVGNVLDVFPVNYVVDDETLLFRTAQGSKLFELTVNDEVLFEVDDHTDTDAWSVIVRGRAHALDTSAEVERADGLGLRPWIPTLKYTYVRVEPTSLSGRAFQRAPEPDRYGVQPY